MTTDNNFYDNCVKQVVSEYLDDLNNLIKELSSELAFISEGGNNKLVDHMISNIAKETQEYIIKLQCIRILENRSILDT